MGKSTAPTYVPTPVPDYTGAAQATAAGNLEAARVQTNANRINQTTPYGNLTYSRVPNEFNKGAMEQALDQYLANVGEWKAGKTDPNSIWYKNKTGPTRPTIDQFTNKNKDLGWEVEVSLSPTEQAKLDRNNALSLGLLDTANKGLGDVNDLLSDPRIDESKLASMISHVGTPDYQRQVMGGDLDSARQQAQDAIYGRQTRMLDPQYQQSEAALRNRLANQGLAETSEAYRTEMDNFARAKDRAYADARDQAITGGNNWLQQQFGMGLQGANLFNATGNQGFANEMQNATLANAMRQQGMQEQAYQQDRPLNVINALRTGNQVSMPNFVNVPNQGFAAGPDYLGAANAQYNAQNQQNQGLYNSQLAGYNANQAQTGNMMSGLFGLGSAWLGGF